MGTRTIIEINHDSLGLWQAQVLVSLLANLGASNITQSLNKANGNAVDLGCGVRVLAQRHHSETLNLKVE